MATNIVRRTFSLSPEAEEALNSLAVAELTARPHGALSLSRLVSNLLVDAKRRHEDELRAAFSEPS